MLEKFSWTASSSWGFGSAVVPHLLIIFLLLCLWYLGHQLHQMPICTTKYLHIQQTQKVSVVIYFNAEMPACDIWTMLKLACQPMLFAACIVCFVQGFIERSNVENPTEWIEIVFFVVVRFSFRKLTALLLQANMSSINLQYIVTVGCNSCLWSHFWHLSKKKVLYLSRGLWMRFVKDRCVCVVI